MSLCATTCPSIKSRFSSTSPPSNFGNVQPKILIHEHFAIQNFLYPANAVSFFEHRYFLSHRPPRKFMKISPFKIFVPLQTLFPSLKIAIFCRIAPLKILCVDKMRSEKIDTRPRGHLCVGKIEPVAPLKILCVEKIRSRRQIF